ncbi:hypothetical protein OIU79_015559 [Salix purpurea]|uniref:RRM domain-containing protein n=1 Tax=Salix purpurea TaxID=77065 RepID=A0A9Q0PC36_SALPP|nr:hypothetical protein OIU79_015559 [Salix purpurea]
MSHFGRSGPPDIRDTSLSSTSLSAPPPTIFSLSSTSTARTGESRGFAFARYKYADEAQKEVDRLDGRVVDGREIMVQFAKFGPNAERIQDGRIAESASKIRRRSRSRSPRRRYKDGYRDRDRDYRRSRSRSRGRYERGYEKERHSQSRSYGSPSSPKSTSPRKAHLRDVSPNGHNDNKNSPTSKSASPHNEPVDS